MSTKAIIAKKTKEGYKAIYVHWDGYPEHTGKILKQYYKNPQKVDELIKLGNLSFLGKEIGSKQDFNNPNYDYVLAYGRDRGEKNTKAKHLKDLKELLNFTSESCAEYYYIYQNGDWLDNEVY
jgi:hypothetical protein